MTAAAPTIDLTDKVVVVTGGSRGLGRAISIGCAERGATVVVASRKVEACRELAAHLRGTTGRPALGLACHVGRWTECDALVEAVLAEYGRVDVLVNNAGMSPLYASLQEVTEELFDKVVAVNLKGAFRLSVLVGQQMAAGGGGTIVNISSVAAAEPSPLFLPYAAAKAGLNTLTVGLARAYAPKVRVNAVMVGAFLTDVSRSWDMHAFEERAVREIPLGRGGRPEEIVGTILYLVSDASTYTTGAVIKVDGGKAFAPA